MYIDGYRFLECVFDGEPHYTVLQLGPLVHGAYPRPPAAVNVRQNTSKTLPTHP